MKAIKIILAAVVLTLTCTSCLHKNLKELKVYEGKDITSAYVYYRYIDESTTYSLSGANAVKQVTLTYKTDINADAGTVDITASIPTNFPQDQLSKISASQLVVAVQISSAAIISPVDDSPALGTPADWTSPHNYIVEAANGTQKEWTISLTLNK